MDPMVGVGARGLWATAPKMVALWLLLVLAVAPAHADGIEDVIGSDRYHALVIGNEDYAFLPKLETPVRNAGAIDRVLRDRYDFSTVFLANATHDAIWQEIENLNRTLTDTDNLLIYYSGRFAIDRDVAFWQGVDARPQAPGTWISTIELAAVLSGMKARTVMVVADTPFSWTTARRPHATLPTTDEQRAAWLHQTVGPRARTAMTLDSGQGAYDGDGPGRSVLTGAFLDALADNKGILDGQTLFALVSRRMVSASLPHLQYQDLGPAGHDGGDFLLVRPGRGSDVAAYGAARLASGFKLKIVFPWPPPRASAMTVVPSVFVRPGGVAAPTLGDVADRIQAILDVGGYFERSYFPAPGGFVMVTRLEQINPDGTSKQNEAERWSVNASMGSRYQSERYLQALFTAPKGYYRVIALIVSSQAFPQSDEEVARAEAMEWLSRGLNTLPDEIGQIAFTEKYVVTALIYEFEQPGHQEARLLLPGNLTGRGHLERARLWDALRQ